MQHPGIELKERIKGFKQAYIAKIIGMQASHFNMLLHGKRPLTPGFCLAMERHFGLNAQQWYRKQADYDLEQARKP